MKRVSLAKSIIRILVEDYGYPCTLAKILAWLYVHIFFISVLTGGFLVIVVCSGNSATYTFLLVALVASMVGLASTLAGAHHVRIWRTDSLA